MIKGITLVHPIASSEAFARLSSLLLSLGFEPGKGWQETCGSGSNGSSPRPRREPRARHRPPYLCHLATCQVDTLTQLDHIPHRRPPMAPHHPPHRRHPKSTPTHPSHNNWNSRLFTLTPNQAN